tara:strand:+ start:483 stop:803 length:321 start_codon:yes stop_codon:yes gene_type:complete
MIRSTAHILLHFIVPAAVAKRWFRGDWQRSFAIMIATMVVDLDHLLADPIYAPNRCSVSFHPLHTWGPIAIYASLCFHPKTRLVGLGLMIHMLLDGIDCIWMGLAL